MKQTASSQTAASRHESGWCPVTCPLNELEDEIASIPEKDGDYGRKKFLEGVRHARIIFAAATGGKVGR